MDGSKSFSIDALLSKDKPQKCTSPVNTGMVSTPLHSPRPSSSGSSQLSSRTPDSSVSPTGNGNIFNNGFIPRPGLLKSQHQALQSASSPMSNLIHAHPFYAYNNNHPGMGNHIPLMAGSAFHSPAEQALKLAQVQGMQPYVNEWLARGGMFMPRMMDYSGKI